MIPAESLHAVADVLVLQFLVTYSLIPSHLSVSKEDNGPLQYFNLLLCHVKMQLDFRAAQTALTSRVTSSHQTSNDHRFSLSCLLSSQPPYQSRAIKHTNTPEPPREDVILLMSSLPCAARRVICLQSL